MLKKVLKFSFSYAFIEGAQKGLLLLITPFLTFYILPDEYGNIAMVLMLVSIFKILFAFSLESTIMRYYLRIKNNHNLSKRFLGSIILFIGLSFILYTIFMLLFGEKFFSYILDDLSFAPYILLAMFLTMFQQLNHIYISILKATQNIREYALFYNLYFLSQTFLIVLMVTNDFVPNDLEYIYALILSNIVFSAVSFYKLKPDIILVFDKKLIRIALSYSLSVLPIQLVNIVNNSLDRYILLLFLGNSAVGVYYLAYQLSSVAQMIMLAINSAFVPMFFKFYEENKNKKDFSNIVNVINSLVYLSGIIEVLLLLSYPLFYFFVDPAYNSSIPVVPILMYSNIILFLYYINTNALSISIHLNRKKILGVLLGVITNAIISFILVKKIGMTGVAIGTLAGYMVSTLYFIFLVKKFTHFNYSNFTYFLFYTAIFLGIEFFDNYVYKVAISICILLVFSKFLLPKGIKHVF